MNAERKPVDVVAVHEWEVRAKRVGRPRRVIGRFGSRGEAEAVPTPAWADYSYVAEVATCKEHLQVAAAALARVSGGAS